MCFYNNYQISVNVVDICSCRVLEQGVWYKYLPGVDLAEFEGEVLLIVIKHCNDEESKDFLACSSFC